jgi:hypothetical protein
LRFGHRLRVRDRYALAFVRRRKTAHPPRGAYIYAGDRWQDPDLKSSKYIWLPLKVNGGQFVLDYHDSWQLDVTTGEWTAP